MNGTAVASAAVLPIVVSADWTMVGGGDFNGDAKADILWRHTNGNVAIWLMNGTTVIGSAVLAITTDWTIESVGDFNGDGKADILWRHTNGNVAVWLMNGTSVVATGSAGAAGNEWQIQ
jgi:hypothetical protein